jgi:hypothetical protein
MGYALSRVPRVDENTFAAWITPDESGVVDGVEHLTGPAVGDVAEFRDKITRPCFQCVNTLDTALIMAADTISGYIQGLLDGAEFKQTAYALDRDSRKAALARFLRKAAGEPFADAEEHRLAA